MFINGVFVQRFKWNDNITMANSTLSIYDQLYIGYRPDMTNVTGF